jgi:glutamine synthetase
METSQDYKMIYYLWINVVGMTCAKLVPYAKYLRDVKEPTTRAAAFGCMMLPSGFDELVPGLEYPNPFVDFIFHPLSHTLRTVPWPSKAKVGFVYSQFTELDGSTYEMCGVTLLNKATERLKKEYGLELKVGIEIEFNVYRKVFKAG